VGVLVFAVLRFASAARETRRLSQDKSETAFVTAALQEALTKLKAQEREMSARAAASERLSEEIVESLTAGLIVVGSEDIIRIVNPAARRMLQLPDKPGNYKELLRHFEPLSRVIDECLGTGQPIVRRKLENPSTAPAITHLGVSVSPLTDGENGLHGVICLFTDLTPVVAMEEQLHLKDSLARVGELTAGIAHEFRNGLATIYGYARLLDLNALPEAYRPHVEGIRQETESLGQVVTNFLNFAKPTRVEFSPVDLRAIVERAAEEIRLEVRAHGGAVTVQGDFPVIQGDDVLLRQAFRNLLCNAVESGIGASKAPDVTIVGKVDARQVRVSVDDNGPGIPLAERERVFTPFVTTKGRGTGLGLALVQKIVVTHNGRIQVGTSPQGGASLQLTLPLETSDDSIGG